MAFISWGLLSHYQGGGKSNSSLILSPTHRPLRTDTDGRMNTPSFPHKAREGQFWRERSPSLPATSSSPGTKSKEVKDRKTLTKIMNSSVYHIVIKDNRGVIVVTDLMIATTPATAMLQDTAYSYRRLQTMTMAMAALAHRWRWTAPGIIIDSRTRSCLWHRLPVVQGSRTAKRRLSLRRQFISSTATTTTTATSTATPTGDDGSDAHSITIPPTAGCGFARILTDEQRLLFHQVNQLSSLSKSLAKQVGNVAVKEDSVLVDIARLRTQTRHQHKQHRPDESTNVSNPPSLFTVVFAGEFNSGKSTLINALLGSELLETGVLPTTDAITVIMTDGGDSGGDAESCGIDEGTTSNVKREISSTRGADSNANTPASHYTHLHLLSANKFPILSDLCLIDTPGTNAILSLQHTNMTLRILHDADLIIFVTSADRPFSESEQNLLRTSIKSYRKRVVLVINKMDVLERQKGEDHGETTKQRVLEYVVEHAGDLLGARPVVIPLSARDALSTKLLYSSSHHIGNNIANEISHHQDGRDYKSTLWNRSNLGELEQL